MLELVPEWLGRALGGVRAGIDRLVMAELARGTDASAWRALRLSSPAFADGARLPPRFTADGAGVSPPLVWSGVPEEAALLALIVEDADAPARRPLVHAIVWGLPADGGALAEGAIAADGRGDEDGTDVGRNSFFGEGWLPPDPPPGHGAHRYVFQLFALAEGPDPGGTPGRGAVVKAMAGRILAAGILTGTYSRGEPAEIGTARAAAAPARPA